MLDADSEARLHVPPGPSGKIFAPDPFLCSSEAAGYKAEQLLASCSEPFSVYTVEYSRKPSRPPPPVQPARTVSYSCAPTCPAPSKEVPDSGVMTVNTTARVHALQGLVSLMSLLK